MEDTFTPEAIDSDGCLQPTGREPTGMQPLPESSFRTRLIEEVQRKLQRAVNSSSQKQDLLRNLFTDVVLEVDNRARGLLYGDVQQLEEAAVHGGGKSSLCFYEILAEHYSQKPTDGELLLPLFNALWSQTFTNQIFAMLLHQWLFEFPASHAEEIQRRSRAFLNGIEELFWLDVQANTKRFTSLFTFVASKVALVPSRFSKLPPQPQKDLVQTVSRFFFFYEHPSRLASLLDHLPMSVSSPFIGGPNDIFVTELTNQLQRIKVEPVLLRYLDCTKSLKGVELRTSTSIRLQVALYSMASPGGPLFPTRAVRHYAKSALDHLFPVGRRFRTVISLGFRLLHPAYWPGSFFNFIKSVGEVLSHWMNRLWGTQNRQYDQVAQQKQA